MTLEYDLAVDPVCRTLMLAALEDTHPEIAKELRTEIDKAFGDDAKAICLFKGEFQRGDGKTKIQEGHFSKLLSYALVETAGSVALPPAPPEH